MTYTIVLQDEPGTRSRLLPLTYTRPVGAIRTGIYTQAGRWKKISGAGLYFETEPYLQKKFSSFDGDSAFFIDGALVATPELWAVVSALEPGEALYREGLRLAVNGRAEKSRREYEGPLMAIRNSWDIFSLAGEILKADYNLAREERISAPLSETNTLIGPAGNLFIEEGAVIEGAVINVSNGPVYIDRDAEVMEGSLVAAPCTWVNTAS